ncbi:Membrane associated serine protease, rhomboid family [Spirosomataceae bacterium TFI 002]|nr:Membrane associated serine protease, rhomboid family [Spirosomataceae bacterium TFI 002]
MTSVFDDIKQAFNNQHNSSVKIILINLFVFLALGIFKFFFSLSPETSFIVPAIKDNLWLSADLTGFLLHPWAVFTFGFINDNLINLIFNSLALFYFGLLIQDFLGTRKLFNVYILGYIFAGIFYVLTYNMAGIWKINISLISPATGSAAAVYAVMFATVTLIPDYEFYFFRLFYIKIKYIALAFLVLSFFMSPGYGLLNLGGAVFGYLYIKFLRTGIDLGSPIESLAAWFSRKESTPSPKPFQAKKYSHSTIGNTRKSTFEFVPDAQPDQEEVDALLDKISTSGYDSLTKEEKQRLYIASKSNDLRTK